MSVRAAKIPPAVTELVGTLIAAIREALPDNLTGAYVCGSLALGGFDPKTSDIDVLVVTERAVSDAEFEALKALHERIPLDADGKRPEYEVYYVDRETIRRFEPGQQHVKAEPGFGVYRTEHRAGWVIERWVVREHGVTLAGPDPKTLIEQVSADEMREAALGELRARQRNWAEGTWPREHLAYRGAQGFDVETVCRGRYTMATGKLCTKDEALDWAYDALPAEFRPLIEFARRYRKDWKADETMVEEVLRMLAWAVDTAQTR